MNKIPIYYVNDQLLENLRENCIKVGEYIKNSENTEWLKVFASGQLFEEKKYSIPDFELKENENNNDLDFENAKILYESLKELPRYILTNENFWVWLELGKCYKVCRQVMPIKSNSTFKDHWLFSGGNRRGVFFGVLSRCFFRFELTVDESLFDKYELTKFIFDKPERFRNLSWRSTSSEKDFVLGVIKAEKDIYDEYINDPEKSELFKKAERGTSSPERNLYTELSKELSLYGSVRLIDALSKDEIYNVARKKIIEIIKKFN